ncbi:MAG: hypothetical protein HQL69_23500 [Magnetococcales bacterium]|nr:hypothetical protein [Magnetococcales bacterium]
MEKIAVADIKVGQSVTLEFGNKEPILTKLEDPRKFKIEDWYEDEERAVYILDDVIEEDEPLHYSFEPFDSLKAGLQAQGGEVFGQNRQVLDFLGRVVDGIEMEEEEEEEVEAEASPVASPEA